jgi:hypothetical protein
MTARHLSAIAALLPALGLLAPMPAAAQWKTLLAVDNVVLRQHLDTISQSPTCWIQAEFAGAMPKRPPHKFQLSIGFDAARFSFAVQPMGMADWVLTEGHRVRLPSGDMFALRRVYGTRGTMLVPDAADADAIVRQLRDAKTLYLRYQGANEAYEAIVRFPSLAQMIAAAFELCPDTEDVRRHLAEQPTDDATAMDGDDMADSVEKAMPAQ